MGLGADVNVLEGASKVSFGRGGLTASLADCDATLARYQDLFRAIMASRDAMARLADLSAQN